VLRSFAVGVVVSAVCASSAAAAGPLKVGQSTVLHGFNGLTMRVTVLKLIDPVDDGSCDNIGDGFDKPTDVSVDTTDLANALEQAAYECRHPGTKDRHVGVKIRLTNIGRTTYSDSPMNGARLWTRTRKHARSAILTDGNCTSDWASSTTIRRGKTQTGCIPFHIHSGRAGRFAFALDSGFADETATWAFPAPKKKHKK
jgi:hypothetical protein